MQQSHNEKELVAELYKTIALTQVRCDQTDQENIALRAKIESGPKIEASPAVERQLQASKTLNRDYQEQLATSNEKVETLERQLKHLKSFIKRNFDRKMLRKPQFRPGC